MSQPADRWVKRIKNQPVGSYKAPRQIYRCKFCPKFSTRSLTIAWTHTVLHGPWPEMGAAAQKYELSLSAQAHRNGLAHPRGESIRFTGG
jgi:hypothetical protein